MKILWQYLKPYKKQVIIGPFFKLSEAVLELLIPILMAYIIDKGVRAGNSDYIIKTGFLMVGTVVLGLLFAYICQYSASIASQGFGTNVRNAVFKHIQSLSYSQVEGYGTASLVNRITNDVNVMQTNVAMMIRLFIRAPFICLGSIVMAMTIDIKLALIFVISLPIFILVIYLIMSRTIPMYKKVQGKTDNIASILRENLFGVRVIRAFNKQNQEAERFQQSNDDYEKLVIKVGKISAILNPATVLLMNLVVAGILYFGANQVNIGKLTQGEITAFISYASYMMQALVVLANLIVLITKGVASASRVSTLLSIEPDISKTNDNSKKNDTAIEFSNVSFSYNKDSDYATQNINFEIKKGESIGIIGGTGSGKSTIINLILRLFDATEGSIYVNGVNVQSYETQALINKIGVVSQKSVLLKGTIADNIRQGNKNATDEDIVEALKVAQAYDFVSKLEDGIYASVSRGGTNFSGGQKQRLSIARAIAKKPEILILDDSSSALDYATESNLSKAISEFSKTMTVINVSQRVSSVINCDKILLLQDGEQIAFASHQELISTNSLYQEICESQLDKKEAGK